MTKELMGKPLAERRPTRKWRHGWQALQLALRSGDALLLALVWGVAAGGWAAVAAPVLGVAVLELARSYDRVALDQRRRQLRALGAAALVAAGVLALSDVPPAHALIALAVSLIVLGGERELLGIAISLARLAGHLTLRVVLVGGGEAADTLASHFATGRDPELRLIGVFDKAADLEGFLRANAADCVVIAPPDGEDEAETAQLLSRLRTVPVRIDVVAPKAVWGFDHADVKRLAGIPVITVANLRVDQQMGWLKRAEDLVLGGALLLLAAPVMAAVAVAVKLDSAGPVLFRQNRFGYNNQLFEIYKFRTMHHAPVGDEQVRQATRDDPRVTRIGKFLRRTSLDELPQLFNVLAGSMSLVGPRPHAVPHNIHYSSVIDEYFARHNVKPGITGWAQVHGVRGETDSDDKMRRRVELDLHYIENWSLGLDLKIVLLTVVRVWFHEAAY